MGYKTLHERITAICDKHVYFLLNENNPFTYCMEIREIGITFIVEFWPFSQVIYWRVKYANGRFRFRFPMRD